MAQAQRNISDRVRSPGEVSMKGRATEHDAGIPGVDVDNVDNANAGAAASAAQDSTNPLHRLREIRSQQDISIRSLSRRMNVTASEVRMQEDPHFDLRLSALYQWQQALGVPASELLVEPGDGLSAPIQLRARLLRMMKTIATILDQPQSDRTTHLIANLKNDILEVMPEVDGVDRWHGSSSDRSGDIAAAVLRQIDDAFFLDQ
ncbi:MAG: helix-turn-helix transcriptional regulator [Planctomycetota bacterium]|nr:helix-turn-helix transcriptional regulator [Planctomycetota bacterium]